MGGASWTRLFAARRGAAFACLATLAVLFTFSSCGTKDSNQTSSLAPSNVLQPSDFSRYPEASAERAFIEYWSDLQYRSWANMAAYYHPRFRDFVGTDAVIGAKKLNASIYPLLKPAIVRVDADGEDTTVYYTLRLTTGSKELNSITLRRDDGNWQIIYDSRLDEELAQLAQNRAEIKEEGALRTDASTPPSAQAVRAAQSAAQLQARFLDEELSTSP